MPKKAKLWCCTIGKRCGWWRNCRHSQPHHHTKPCDTPCKRKLLPHKCDEIVVCDKCEGKGYHFGKSGGKK